ncbi:DUF6265 family protein [Flavobacterium sp. NG2]|uniref:DUF6265 family protein n=1 Tax=Flavobacterium sp. NG2 TaxID=3097547 RepID=UPI002A837D4C|nr:DUF6265 family protein [Flavobacterium sp. NG2]WPR70233.1 DUF6265 family protein [Flavobacterium sp. NG2]
MVQKITLLLLIIALVSCNNSNSKSDKELIQSAQGLLGTWEYQAPDGILVENWIKVNDSTYNGSSLFIKGKDTIHQERIVLQQLGENLTYKTLIKGQNNNEPIVFLYKETEENKLVFENTNNDYPQLIKYTVTVPNKLTAEISGLQLKKPHSEKYTLGKKN